MRILIIIFYFFLEWNYLFFSPFFKKETNEIRKEIDRRRNYHAMKNRDKSIKKNFKYKNKEFALLILKNTFLHLLVVIPMLIVILYVIIKLTQ